MDTNFAERQCSPTHEGEPNNNEIRTEDTEPNVLGGAPCSPLDDIRRLTVTLRNPQGQYEERSIEYTLSDDYIVHVIGQLIQTDILWETGWIQNLTCGFLSCKTVDPENQNVRQQKSTIRKEDLPYASSLARKNGPKQKERVIHVMGDRAKWKMDLESWKKADIRLDLGERQR
jgi:hypothetical protein